MILPRAPYCEQRKRCVWLLSTLRCVGDEICWTRLSQFAHMNMPIKLRLASTCPDLPGICIWNVEHQTRHVFFYGHIALTQARLESRPI